MTMKRVDATGIQRLLYRERRDLAHLQHEEVRPFAFGRIIDSAGELHIAPDVPKAAFDGIQIGLGARLRLTRDGLNQAAVQLANPRSAHGVRYAGRLASASVTPSAHRMPPDVCRMRRMMVGCAASRSRTADAA